MSTTVEYESREEMERYVKEKQDLAGCSYLHAEGQKKPGLLD